MQIIILCMHSTGATKAMPSYLCVYRFYTSTSNAAMANSCCGHRWLCTAVSVCHHHHHYRCRCGIEKAFRYTRLHVLNVQRFVIQGHPTLRYIGLSCTGIINLTKLSATWAISIKVYTSSLCLIIQFWSPLLKQTFCTLYPYTRTTSSIKHKTGQNGTTLALITKFWQVCVFNHILSGL